MKQAAAAKSFFAAAAFLFLLPALAAGQRSDVPAYVPTHPDVVERMIGLAEVGPDDFVIDLGSGDGRILIAAAKKGARGFGVEIDPKLVKLSNENAAKAGVGLNVSFIQQDLYETPLSAASVVAMYLLPQANFKLRPRLLKELRPGTRIISHEFGMAGWLPDLQETVRGTEVFLWIVPAQVAGDWTVKIGDREISLQIKQLFQELTATSKVGTRDTAIGLARLRGEQIQLVIQNPGNIPLTLEGIVDGDTMHSTPNSEQAWSAKRKRPGE